MVPTDYPNELNRYKIWKCFDTRRHTHSPFPFPIFSTRPVWERATAIVSLQFVLLSCLNFVLPKN